MNHKVLIKSNKSNNYIVTIAIGNKYLKEWIDYAKPTWIKYCKNHKLGLIVIIKDLIDKKDQYWKKATWQKMLLGSYLQNRIKIKNMCYLDTDILINPNSPNIFNQHNEKRITVISESFNMPYNLDFAKKKLAFLRNRYYSKRYPLDSSLHMSVKQKYEFHNIKPQKDYACAGVFVINIKKFSKIFESWFYKYEKNIKTLTGGGDEPIFNYEVFNSKKVKLLSYKFQALWMYEMAIKFPFLYKMKKNKKLIKECIESTMMDNYFLHFAGSWHEGKMWKIRDIFSKIDLIKFDSEFSGYLKKKLSGKPKGRILPK